MNKLSKKQAQKLAEGKPVHPHDCGACVFLGTIPPDGKFTLAYADLYYCGKGDLVKATVVARTGVDGDYASGIVSAFGDRIPALKEALRRAVKKGLIKDYTLKGTGLWVDEIPAANAEIQEWLAS
ncbi:MAG: hypothetical protein UU77_C0003G0055 [candidate division WWE3 bacterium GW2011_GWC1_41_7]|uniref:Uncharacterized protein n=4 Tax=Katanobacteria TaxID=422282 RepID=A0A0G0XAL4_UNCKA|nr:MAG: hypothetical protein UU72_C0014G0021 [candidate division WWE3 bacterium GW2011_GWB1_41_6]KKS21427.1 MAG: hypothetical protein UU77_C0003G0055 [candidate division WWE3 bacterium GW2011_GWC1_41_7]KKS22224.1 MAG: hypothetical protein UU80_C0011G0030 [candidate division WWE3 bacterium GW2011_GWA1_41_8]OGC57011.1 MAG: hypothetical protein A2976_00240 [candidate division WWE3 bacterium RIFCSPLOWO2_01_FULL_41_9]